MIQLILIFITKILPTQSSALEQKDTERQRQRGYHRAGERQRDHFKVIIAQPQKG